MQTEDVAKLISDQLDDVEVNVQSDGSHYQVVAIGKVFEGLSPVKKQQLIYGCLNPLIMDGTIHAVIIKTFTPEEWQNRKQD
jgi:acid stress-induced BolA-like protein IbaG/YrbA